MFIGLAVVANGFALFADEPPVLVCDSGAGYVGSLGADEHCGFALGVFEELAPAGNLLILKGSVSLCLPIGKRNALC